MPGDSGPCQFLWTRSIESGDEHAKLIRDRWLAQSEAVSPALWTADAGSDRDLCEYLCRADAFRFHILFRFVADRKEEAITRLTAILAQEPATDAHTDDKERLARRQASAAAALLRLKHDAPVWPHLQFPVDTGDPRLRTHILHHLSELDAPPSDNAGGDAESPILRSIVNRLGMENVDDTEQRILILAIGELQDRLAPGQQVAEQRDNTSQESAATSQRDGERTAKKISLEYADIHAKILEEYQNNADAGVHSAAQWTLRQMGTKTEDLVLSDAQKSMSAKEPGPGDRNWYLDANNHTMIILAGSSSFRRGSPNAEQGRDTNESRHQCLIPRTFAIAAHETTVRQFLDFWGDEHGSEGEFEYAKQYSGTLNCPINSVSWFVAAEYCNWLSDREGLEKCYEPSTGGNGKRLMALVEGYLGKNGYRLPTEAEWEYACRARTTTAWFFGDAAELQIGTGLESASENQRWAERGPALLGYYAHYKDNSGEAGMQPVGRLKPSDFGLFDTHGNAYEWCSSIAWKYPENDDDEWEDVEIGQEITDSSASRSIRSGSFVSGWRSVRSGNRNNNQPDNANNNNGFRVASTLRRANVSVVPESTGLPDLKLSCGVCQSVKSRPSSRVGSTTVDSAEFKTGPAGLVGRQVRTPRRAIFSGDSLRVAPAYCVRSSG